MNEAESAPLAIVPEIDGVPLTDLAQAFEVERGYVGAGGYGGIVPDHFDYGPLDSYYCGQFETDSNWARLGRIYVLGCDCGEVGCWPLVCEVTRQDSVVMWHRFRQPYRPERNYSSFGPFAFSWSQYREAVNALCGQVPGRMPPTAGSSFIG